MSSPARVPSRRALEWSYGSSVSSAKAVPRVSAVAAWQRPPRLAVHPTGEQRWPYGPGAAVVQGRQRSAVLDARRQRAPYGPTGGASPTRTKPDNEDGQHGFKRQEEDDDGEADARKQAPRAATGQAGQEGREEAQPGSVRRPGRTTRSMESPRPSLRISRRLRSCRRGPSASTGSSPAGRRDATRRRDTRARP